MTDGHESRWVSPTRTLSIPIRTLGYPPWMGEGFFFRWVSAGPWERPRTGGRNGVGPFGPPRPGM